ncbi:hypothetical protein GCM10012275_00830 [Longimycelium tulufanense]|uniref:Uncharacterized protein n=1 Tax=Longimycelium tulufanense TaxID=907463 RepID=A0A8J3FSX3_9PSEU|nr:hypothetical protein [Longimycelium tulufanense]GGM33203.1 hypothetical protein GCM10012275_00830 [Longimycelium tulufanense]
MPDSERKEFDDIDDLVADLEVRIRELQLTESAGDPPTTLFGGSRCMPPNR